MDYRTGKCSQCGAEYKVPASFAHNVARCKKCKGVVHLSPAKAVGGGPAAAPAASAAMPAKRVVPKPAAATEGHKAPAPAPAEGERPRGGTLERLKSERAAATPPAATPAPRPAAAPAPAGAPRAAREGRKPKDEGQGSGARGRQGQRGRGSKEKKPPVAGILAGAALVVLAAGVFLFRDSLFGGDAKAAGDGAQVAQEAGAQSPTANAPAAAAKEAPPAPEETAREVVETPAEEPAKPAKAEPKSKDPSSIDLAGMPDFQPTPDTSAEEWAQMNEWAAQWMDVDAGAAGNRAKLELVKQTRKAVPVILNVFKKLDFATKEGRSNGDQCQKALQQICNGTNFDWKYADEANGRGYDNPDDVWFCKKVVELWSNSWKQGEKNINAWIKMAKLDDKDPAEAARLRERFGGTSEPEEPDPSAGKADDLDVD